MKANGQNGLQISQKLYSSAQSKPSVIVCPCAVRRSSSGVIALWAMAAERSRPAGGGGRSRCIAPRSSSSRGGADCGVEFEFDSTTARERKKGRMPSLMILSTQHRSTGHYSPIRKTTPWLPIR